MSPSFVLSTSLSFVLDLSQKEWALACFVFRANTSSELVNCLVKAIISVETLVCDDMKLSHINCLLS